MKNDIAFNDKKLNFFLAKMINTSNVIKRCNIYEMIVQTDQNLNW